MLDQGAFVVVAAVVGVVVVVVLGSVDQRIFLHWGAWSYYSR